MGAGATSEHDMANLGAPVPILRMFDEGAARAFYLDFLGFEIVFEHRFEDDLPLYMEVRRGGCRLHLSQHHGDATPGAHIRIPIGDIDGFQQALAAKAYGFARPGAPEVKPWGARELTLADPSGNRLTFHQGS